MRKYLLWLARCCAAVLVLPLSTQTAKITVDGDIGEWKTLQAVLQLPLLAAPDQSPAGSPYAMLTYDGKDLFLAFNCPQKPESIVTVPITTPFSDALWRRGDRLEWYVKVGDETFHYGFTPHGDAFRIIVKPGGFEEGHATEFTYKAKVGDDGWSGEVQIPLEESPFPLPKAHPDWAMRFVLTQAATRQSFAWPASKTPAEEQPLETIHFANDPPAPETGKP